MRNAMRFNVYKTLSGIYVAEEICNLYNVGDKSQKKTIKFVPCYRVVEQDINTIVEHARKNGEELIPDIVTIFDLQLVLSFIVYRDINHDNKLYVLGSTCNKYDVAPISKRIIKGQTYFNVSEEGIAQIEEKTKNDKVVYKRKYEDIDLKDEIKPADQLFMCYCDYNANKMYINREMFDLARKNDIEIEGEPKIIYNKNCYSITENQLKEIEQKLCYRRVEQLLQPKMNRTVLQPKSVKDIEKPKLDINFPNVDKIQEVIDKAREFGKEFEAKQIINKRLEETIKDEDYEDEEDYEEDKEQIIIYKDKNTNKLYSPYPLSNPYQKPVNIMHKLCYETTTEELKEIEDETQVIIVSVFPVEKKVYDIIICNNNGQLYISKNILEELGFYIENPHKIIVNKEIYEEITEEDLELVKNKESDSCHINIVIKQIAPKRG